MQIGRIKNNSYFEYSCIPDIYTIGLQQNNDPGIRRYFEEERTYYFKVEIQGSTWRPIPVMIEMDSVIAAQTIKTKALSNLISVNNRSKFITEQPWIEPEFWCRF